MPFISFFVASLGISKEGQGIYTGLLFASYNIAQFFSSAIWGSLSDRFGRKICLTLGLLGAGFSVAWFGMSRSYLSAFCARFVGGLLNGNLGVSKSVLAEVTDKSNRAQAFAWLPLAYGTSCVLAPVIGGLLSEPVKQYPDTFSESGFFGTYPYALPCFVCATYALIAAVVVQLVFIESLKSAAAPMPGRLIGHASAESTLSNPQQTARVERKAEPTLKLLLQEDVWFATSSYGLIAFVYMVFDGFLPLFCQRPLDDYGLAYSSRDIGIVMSASSIIVVPLSIYLPPRLDRKFGKIWLFRIPHLPNALCTAIVPLTCFLPGPLAWLVLAVILTIMGIGKNLTFLSVMLLINNSVPMSRLGQVNGIGQSWAALARSSGPAFGGLIWGMAVVVGGPAILLPFLMNAFMIWYAYDYGAALPRSLEVQKPDENDN